MRSHPGGRLAGLFLRRNPEVSPSIDHIGKLVEIRPHRLGNILPGDGWIEYSGAPIYVEFATGVTVWHSPIQSSIRPRLSFVLFVNCVCLSKFATQSNRSTICGEILLRSSKIGRTPRLSPGKRARSELAQQRCGCEQSQGRHRRKTGVSLEQSRPGVGDGIQGEGQRSSGGSRLILVRLRIQRQARSGSCAWNVHEPVPRRVRYPALIAGNSGV